MPEITPMTPARFRLFFPEFDADTYPDDRVSFWIEQGMLSVTPERWHELYEQGLALLVAHNLVMQQREIQASSLGGTSIPGAVQGSMASKTVDNVSSAYNQQGIVREDIGAYGLTNYGIRYYDMLMNVGAGGVQL
jgi:hypothetical protein